MSDSMVHLELNIPKKYTKSSIRSDRVEAIVNKNWLKQLIKTKKVPDFILHDRLSDDETSSLFKQGENFSPEWQKIVITVLAKRESLVIPLPRVRFTGKPSTKLSLSQTLQYVSLTNCKNLWKEAYKKYSGGMLGKEETDERSVQLMEQPALLREIIARVYGVPIIRDGHTVYDPAFKPHPNLFKATIALETNRNFFIIHESRCDFTVLDCVTFSPAVLSGSFSRPLFILYQTLRLMRHLHDLGLLLGSITLADIYISQDLWVQILPRLVDNIHESPSSPPEEGLDPPKVNHSAPTYVPELFQLTRAWVVGAVSNFDYLCELNRLAGRRYGDPRSHYVLPWVTDFSSRSGANYRDLTKSKFRLNKGDRQLDLTYELPPSANSAQIRHHIPDVLSEITYYVYLSRVTPKSILCKYVRPQWVPGEYPASVQRLQVWTPDECIPEFFTDPSVFKSIHSDLGDLEVPPWCSSPQDFIASHRAVLESPSVSEKLHHWIDLTFGYKLSGGAAVKSKNVCLQLVDGHKKLSGSGVVQLFTQPHPPRARPSLYLRKTPPRIHQQPKCDEEDGHSSGLEEEEPIPPAPLSLSRFISRSRTSLLSTSPLSVSPGGAGGTDPDKSTASIILPKDYNPVEALVALESLQSFFGGTCTPGTQQGRGSEGSRGPKHGERCRQVLANTRAAEMQGLGCLLVELFLAQELRVFGSGLSCTSHSERLTICRKVFSSTPSDLIPKCVSPLINLLLQERGVGGVTETGLPPPSAHQLLQPLLSSPLHFPPPFSLLYSVLEALRGLSQASLSLSSSDDLLIIYKMSEMKVKNLSAKIEELVESEVCLDILLPYIIDMLSSPLTDVLAAWYLFDHVARALGPKRCREHLLEAIVHLYDWERPRDGRLLQKRVKLYHRSFLVKLMVRFGLSVFLDVFVPILCEGVAGYHDLEQPHSFLSCGEVEEGMEAEDSLPLSPLDEDLSLSSDQPPSPPPALTTVKDHTSHSGIVEVFQLDEEASEETPQSAPLSATSLKNLLIDNPESEEKDCDDNVFTSENSWRRKSYSSYKKVHVEQETPELEYSKIYCREVCEVCEESVGWLSHRLGPVLTSRHLGRGLLRLLGLAYTGSRQLGPASSSSGYLLQGDSTTRHLIRSLAAIHDLFGDGVVTVQYLPHATELLAHCERRLSPPLEGALVGSLALLAFLIPRIQQSTFDDIFQEILLRGTVESCLRLTGSRSLLFPSGAPARRALLTKLHSILVQATRRSSPPQRLRLLQTLQRFFLVFSKAYSERPSDSEAEGDLCGSERFSDLSLKSQAVRELREAMSPELALLLYTPFSDYFGDHLMEQNLKNYDLLKQLTAEYLRDNDVQIAKRCQIELRTANQDSPLTPVGSFSNVVVIGNRIEIQRDSKSASPGSEDTSTKSSKKNEPMNRHLHGNWLAYWEHELGRNKKESSLNIKQIKLQTFAGHTNSVKHIVPLGSENSFMSASRDKTVRLWSLRSQGDGGHTSQAQWSYTGHRKSVLSLAWVERSRLTASSDGSLHLWDPFVGRLVSVVEGGGGGGRSVVNCLRSGRAPSAELLCATTDPLLRSLDTRLAAFTRELKISQSGGSLVRCMVISPGSRWVAVGQATGQLTVLDMIMGGLLSSWKAHDAEVLQLVAVDEQTLISSALDQAVSVWSALDGQLLYNLKGPTEPVHCLDVYCGSELVWGTTANRLGVQSATEPGADYTSTKLRPDCLKGVLTSLAVLPLNRLLLCGADSGLISLLC